MEILIAKSIADAQGMTLFHTTRWSLIRRASNDATDAKCALEILLKQYLPAVHAYYTALGVNEPDDQTQQFFLSVIEGRFLSKADEGRGRFRAFLKKAAKNHWLLTLESQTTQKRGGEKTHVDLTDDLQCTSSSDPGAAFDRAYALATVNTVYRKMRCEIVAKGKEDLLDLLEEYLVERADSADYSRISSMTGIRPNTLAVAVKRLRERFRELLRLEVLETVEDSKDLEDEINLMKRSLAV